MKYISIGAVINPANESIVEVSHGGNTFKLTGELAYIWLSGRFQFSHASTILEQKALQQLLQMGLAKPCDGTEAGEYRALTQCTIVAAKTLLLKGHNGSLWLWLWLWFRGVITTDKCYGAHCQKSKYLFHDTLIYILLILITTPRLGD